MRSELIQTAMAQGNNRFEICQKVGKGVRITHKSGTRLQDSILQMLGRLGSEPAVPRHQPRAATTDEPI